MAGRGSYPLGNPFGGAPGRASVAGPPGFDAATINAALQPYGVSMPTSYAQPGPAENTSWGQSHPGIATGIDNALIAVGGMGPTGATAGENISNVARGVMGIEPYRREYMSQQAMVPFQYAKEVGGLQAQQSYMKMQQAMGTYYGDRGQAAVQANQQRMEAAQLKAQMQANLQPRLNKDANGEFVEQPVVGDDFKVSWQRSGQDPGEYKEQLSKGKFAQRFGQSATSQYVGNALANHYGGWDKIPDVLDAKGMKVWQQAIRESTPAVYNAAMGVGERQNEDWHRAQLDIINRGMPKGELSGTDLKAVQDTADAEARQKGLGYRERKTYVGNAVKDAQTKALQGHDQYMTHASQFTALPDSEQMRIGGFGNYMQSQGVGGPPASAPSATGTPASDPVANFLNALKKPTASK